MRLLLVLVVAILYFSAGGNEYWSPYSKITIETPDGKVLGQGNSAVPDKPRELSASAPELAPGKYIVRYRVLSTDGHIVEGNYEFTVDAK